MSEIKLKRKFREVVGVWSETYETRSGGGVGYPDLQLLVCSILVPVELKGGRFVEGILKPDRIRPSQIVWHDEFKKAGGRSHIVVLFETNRKLWAWALPAVNREVTSQWKAGYSLADCVCWVARGELIIDLVDLLPKINDKPICDSTALVD